MNLSTVKQLLKSNRFKAEIVKQCSDFVSIANKSIPSAGSHTAPLDHLIESELLNQITSVINHKNGLTLKTNIVNLRFWNK